MQGKVAQFNGLAKEAAQRRKDNEAALKRAVLGREEAEGESRRLRESNERLRLEIEEGRGRERRVAGRVEGLQVRYNSSRMLTWRGAKRHADSCLTLGRYSKV